MREPLGLRAVYLCVLLAFGSAGARAAEPLLDIKVVLRVEASALPVAVGVARDLEHTFPGDRLALHCSLRNLSGQAVVVYWVPRQICSRNVRVERLEPPARLPGWDIPYGPRKRLETHLAADGQLDFVADVTGIYRPMLANQLYGPYIVQPGKYRVHVSLPLSVAVASGQEAQITLQTDPVEFDVLPLPEHAVDGLMAFVADPRKADADRDMAATVAVFGTALPPPSEVLGKMLKDVPVGVELAGIVGAALRAAADNRPVLVDQLEALAKSDAQRPLVRAVAMWALGEQKAEESVALLVKLIDDNVPGNGEAIRALAAIGSPEALKALERVAAGEGFTPEQSAIAARVLKTSTP